MRKINLLFWLFILAAPFPVWANCPSVIPESGKRYLVVISDLHFGIGKKDGVWDPTEDFRWSAALNSFLSRVSECGKENVDLVIAGDSMELWQPPPEITCAGANADTGCTRAEFLALAKLVTSQHKKDFAAFGTFSNRGSNRVFFVPGNHDAALLLDEVWKEVKRAVGSKSSRIFRCGPKSSKPCLTNASWVSDDGYVLIEHGHQIGTDVNQFTHWPSILTTVNGKEYIERPWGQWFVQSLYNAEERKYSIIDNLIPEAAGARYRLASRGLAGTASDIARFLRFNLVETSLSQKKIGLGTSPSDHKWDITAARGRGYRLFVDALPQDDEFRAQLQGTTPQAGAVQSELTALLADESKMPATEVKLLCDQIAIRQESGGCTAELGSAVAHILHSKSDIISAHLKVRLSESELRRMRVFIYAHTHQLESEWAVKPPGELNEIAVFNTGAFQRLVEEQGFLKRARERHIDSAQALSELPVEALPACYTAVVVAQGTFPVKAVTVRWHMEERSTGKFVSPADAVCQ